jgi:surfeit locus 1 family protein
MIRRVPLLPTIIVAAAVIAMVGLGVWQLQRADWKEALIARYTRSQSLSAAVPWPRDEAEMEQALFRHSGFTCERVLEQRVTAARNLAGESGVAQIARGAIGGGAEAEVALGWSPPTEEIHWPGGEVSGVIAPGGLLGGTLHAAQPPAGLQPLAPPDPSDLPNNHLAYAVQWFFFALTALVIYVLALRKRWRER